MSKVDRLARVIDVIARKCSSGLPALLGERPKPSRDEMRAAYLFRPKGESVKVSGGTGDAEIVAEDCFIDEFLSVLDSVPWEDIVRSVKWCSSDPATARSWEIYYWDVLYDEMSFGRIDGGPVQALAERAAVSESTVKRIRNRVPHAIAKMTLSGQWLLKRAEDRQHTA
ncbi:hypothetical protein [Pyramidobacter piscolens]|uniref:hypothetical protein n=1 Tax=Pyramidobacter piscolens TaxID=638849 RepID=UPI001FCA64EE|nr:hypothetical protein [Pyramidobacter piscolens]BDF78638.1 hypothetical protein CE91St28_14320 [Pyramidobacter piscolens]